MLLLFSMQTFRKSIYNIPSAESFGDILSNFHCEVCFTTQYLETKGKVFIAQPYGSWDTLIALPEDETIYL